MFETVLSLLSVPVIVFVTVAEPSADADRDSDVEDLLRLCESSDPVRLGVALDEGD